MNLIERLEQLEAERNQGTTDDELLEVFDALPKLLAVVEAAEDYLTYVPSGDLFGASKYSEQIQKAKALREALTALEGNT